MIRTAEIHPNRIAWIYNDKSASYRGFYLRTLALANLLSKMGISRGDTVSVMLPNTPPMLESHFGVPMAGAVLNTINTRLDKDSIRFILDHGKAKVFIVDFEYLKPIKEVIIKLKNPPIVIVVNENESNTISKDLKTLDYETNIKKLLNKKYVYKKPLDEWDTLSLNYTSGTTGKPKGVVYHHRGAYLLAINNQLVWNIEGHPNYLWTLPMFHCNGWCFPWTITALAGTHICMRSFDGKKIIQSISKYKITHLCGAPIVLNMILEELKNNKVKKVKSVNVMTAAAPPPPSTIKKTQEAGFKLTHVYGLTECYGPAVVCEWKEEWDTLNPDQQAELKSRQGVKYPSLENLNVINPKTNKTVPRDGKTIGEVVMAGNIVMKGYWREKEETEKAFTNGWFHTGDLGVIHSDGYIQLKDRSKDIIISGGENISSIEVENIIHQHPKVSVCAVVAIEDKKWGETPCAFIELVNLNKLINEKEIIDFCRKRMAHFKVPKKIVFQSLPKTSTGKIQKFHLRKLAKTL